jgi:hypothetical protein
MVPLTHLLLDLDIQLARGVFFTSRLVPLSSSCLTRPSEILQLGLLVYDLMKGISSSSDGDNPKVTEW